MTRQETERMQKSFDSLTQINMKVTAQTYELLAKCTELMISLDRYEKAMKLRHDQQLAKHESTKARVDEFVGLAKALHTSHLRLEKVCGFTKAEPN